MFLQKQILVSKFNQNHIVSEQSEDEDGESMHYLKGNADGKHADDVDSKYSNSVKASASGIWKS